MREHTEREEKRSLGREGAAALMGRSRTHCVVQGKSAVEYQEPEACITWKGLWIQLFHKSNDVKREVKDK